jgi:hypothetical protein
MLKQKKLKVSFPKEEKNKNWISIIALIVAIFGGVPGIFAITNYFYTNRVIFRFLVEAIVSGEFVTNNTENRTFLMLVGAATNKGNKPLNPARFDLKVRIKDKWIPFERTIIPPDDMFNQSKDNIRNFEIKDAAKNDLQEWSRPITLEEPARGNLLFTSRELNIESIRDRNDITFQLTCRDVYEDEYIFTTTYGPFTDVNTPKKMLKYNIYYGPKN